jgi:hypothetical protein
MPSGSIIAFTQQYAKRISSLNAILPGKLKVLNGYSYQVFSQTTKSAFDNEAPK